MKASLYLCFLALAALAACQPKNKPVRPVRKDITQAVYASGKVYPAKYYRVVASVPGYLDRVLVHIGDTVTVGQPLFHVKNELSDLNVKATANTLELATRNAGRRSPLLSAAGQEVEAARARFELDSLNYGRYATLQQAGAGTLQAFDQLRTQLETSKVNLKRALANLESTRLRLDAERSNAETAYKAQRTSRDVYTVRSTIRGRIYDQVPRTGEYVGPQTVVMELGETDRYEVELAIDETDINLVRAGLEVYYGSDAMQKTLAHGTVLEVYPKISSVNKSIKAIATIALPPGQQVYAGSTLEANIVYGRKNNALVLPRAYVVNDSVTVRRKGKYRRIPIKTGLQDVQFSEILSGVDETTEVYRP